MINRLKEKWPEILDNLITGCDLSELSFKTWIEPLKIHSVANNTVTLIFPDNSVGLNYINKRYQKYLQFFISEALGQELEVKIILPLNIEQVTPEKKIINNITTSTITGINPNYTFDSFVVGEHNNMAHAASLAVAEAPADIYNPLFIYGGVGLGKTHLMHSIANFISAHNPSSRILYATSEKFINEVIEMIRNKNESAKAEFRNKYRNIDVLLIDDIQFIIGKESCQTEFFHTFNFLYEQKKQIIISSDKPPKDMETLEERLQSRFLCGLTVDVQQPTYETRMAILRKKAEMESIYVDDEVIQYIATNIKSNIRELEGALKKIKLYSKLSITPVDITCAEKVLKDFIPNNAENEITAKNIINIVSEHFNLSNEDIVSKKKSKDIAYPRQIAMYLCRTLTDTSYESIGNLLGGKDHTTVKYGVEKIQSDIEKIDSTRATIEILKKKIIPS